MKKKEQRKNSFNEIQSRPPPLCVCQLLQKAARVYILFLRMTGDSDVFSNSGNRDTV